MRHPAYKLCVMLAEIWTAFYSVIRVVRTNQWALFDRELPELFERSQMLLELCKVVFGKYSPYLASFNNIVLHHCWQAHASHPPYSTADTFTCSYMCLSPPNRRTPSSARTTSALMTRLSR